MCLRRHTYIYYLFFNYLRLPVLPIDPITLFAKAAKRLLEALTRLGDKPSKYLPRTQAWSLRGLREIFLWPASGNRAPNLFRRFSAEILLTPFCRPDKLQPIFDRQPSGVLYMAKIPPGFRRVAVVMSAEVVESIHGFSAEHRQTLSGWLEDHLRKTLGLPAENPGPPMRSLSSAAADDEPDPDSPERAAWIERQFAKEFPR